MQLIIEPTAGLWWVLLGMFIAAAAMTEERQARAGAVLAGIRVRDVMSHPIAAVDGNRPSSSSSEQPHPRSRAICPVLDPTGRVGGVITGRAISAVPQPERGTTALRRVARPTERIATASPEEPLTALLPRLSEEGEGCVLVLAEDGLVGIVAPSDISRAAEERGLHLPVPGASTAGSGRPPPPPGWWYPGQPSR
ncbi:CBS domain-containing protein [Saccharopolyspora erythraea]|uniref:CBS domain-containing protein n=1 Tax=Saccharopolyspora erythraea TaxID=1836 RepID=UPI0020125A02|nr:CBS domain-containing protein [Saccharopolyspora erythraea]